MTITKGTPYDDAFRTLLSECPRLIIPVVNEMFGENYSGDEDGHLGVNERMIQLGFDEGKRITDSNFTIGENKAYHIESQSTDDGSIAFRMVQYDLSIAMEEADYGKGYINLTYPDSGIIYLRDTASTPDEIWVRINVPRGHVEFSIPTLKVCRYSVEEIFEKKLYFIIPFHLFVYEKEFREYNEDNEKLKQLIDEYRNIIRALRRRLTGTSEGDKAFTTVVDLTGEIADRIADCYSNIQEGVKEPMYGQVIETDFLRRVHQAESEGRAEEREESMKKVVRLMRSIGASDEQIIDGLVDEFQMTDEKAAEYVK